MAAFDDLFGNPSAGTTLSEADLRHVTRRAQRLAGRGVQPPGVAGARARASEQAELAREISAALQGRDVVRAQALIQEGERVFGRAAMVDAVQLQASQDRTAALETAGEPYHRELDPWADDRAPHYPDDEDWLEDEPR
jgi:hypothetical protein